MLLGFGELNLHACTIESECKVASIPNALLIYRIHIRTQQTAGDKSRCPLVAILGRNPSPLPPYTGSIHWFFTFAKSQDIDTRPADNDDDDDAGIQDTGDICQKENFK